MAEEKKIEETMLDPIAYREDYPKESIISEMPNESFSAYGDDSDLVHQQQALGGVNDKYEGEGVGVINYNEDATLSNLPNYKYGKEANQTGEDKYLSNRNDNIASALFNEGKLTKEDVANYLAQQEGWMNSSEMDRMNTIESIWKRLGVLGNQNKKDEKAVKEEKADISTMEEDLNKDTSSKIYGKTTADEGNPSEGITTLSDDNNIYKIMERARVASVEEMINIGVDGLATMLYTGSNVFNEQNWRDFRKYYPTQSALVDQKVKELNVQDNVNAIASGGNIKTNSDNVDTNGEAVSYAVNNTTSSTSATQLLKSIDSILESNDTAKSAEDLMGSIEEDMAKLKNRYRNLRAEANSAFKGDVPDYIVNAYINNKSQEIQNQLSILEDRYNSAYTRYKTELSHAEWQAEFDLKKDSLELDWWKAKNSAGTSSSKSSSNYTVAERNNNPLNMTVDFMKIMGGELGVDYEVSTDSFVNSNGGTQYYAKLIGDPVETTIRVLDRAVSNGMNPFTTKSWSYINAIGMSKEKWNSMSYDEKANFIRDTWLPREGGNMDNMAYYVDQRGDSQRKGFDTSLKNQYEKYLSGDYNKAWLEATAESAGVTPEEFGTQAREYSAAKDTGRDPYDDSLRNVDEELGYIPDKGEIYGAIIAANYKIPKTQQEMILKSLGLSSSDGKAREKATSEASRYAKDQNSNESALEMLDAIEYIMMQASTKAQRDLATSDWTSRASNRLSGEASSWKSSYDFIKDNLTLDHLVELKKNGATFGALSNQELDAIGHAASRLDSSMGEEEFRKEINKMYNKLRKNAGYNELPQSELNSMWDAEKHQDFTNYITRDKSNGSGVFGWGTKRRSTQTTTQSNDKLAQIGTGSIGTGINFMDVVENGRG